ncbi:hypothetical protein [Rhodoferax sediminis]|uniref:Uncharacterized protein n=1 Tax=Rhodoferax sediminis TaxID=2509614 RepID=A0A515DA04_9BURK|nr:hypothetical protein [Rhodoferax sediminis]QDL37226.1 hypothetical protein EUB48_07950 [Rhodoferax sediminis]
MSTFDALTLALKDWFDTPLCDLPETLRHRVEQEFFPMPWEKLSADQRRSVALQMDYQRDPATEQDQKFWWDFLEQVDGIKKRIAEWEVVATPTAAELATKAVRLAELKQELTRMEAHPTKRPSDSTYTQAIEDTSEVKENRGSTVQRDARKLRTQALYKQWQKAHRALIKTHPNMSDLWYSQRIAKTEIAKKRSAETIRKHMKP